MSEDRHELGTRDEDFTPVERREVPPSFFGVPDGEPQENVEAPHLTTDPAGVALYYGVARGQLCTRDGRALFATEDEWSMLSDVHALVRVGKHGPMFGSLPLMANGAPDVVGRLIEVLSFLESGAQVITAQSEHITQAAQDAAAALSARVHERLLLERAATLLDEDASGPTYEQRLDWLAKYREVIARG